MRIRLGLCVAMVAATGALLGAAPSMGQSVSGDRNLGVLNQPGRTFGFDNGWRFALVNTKDVTDPTGTYGTSPDPKAATQTLPAITNARPEDWVSVRRRRCGST